MPAKPLVIMGIFVADVMFRTAAMPVWGQTLLGTGFKLGPGGKGAESFFDRLRACEVDVKSTHGSMEYRRI
jgi:ribokinase